MGQSLCLDCMKFYWEEGSGDSDGDGLALTLFHWLLGKKSACEQTVAFLWVCASNIVKPPYCIALGRL